jgi:predicted ATPase
MKLTHLKIQNFRGIQNFEYDFMDDLGRPYDVTLIAGPNGSGKTAILDAIWFGLMGVIGYRPQRASFRMEPQYVVTTGEKFAQVDYTIEISEEEQRFINEWGKELKVGDIRHFTENAPRIAEISWTYPPQPSYTEWTHGLGGYMLTRPIKLGTVMGKFLLGELEKITALSIEGEDVIGSIYFFEQERQINARPIQHYRPVPDYDPVSQTNDDSTRHENNIRELLIDFGLKDKVGRFPSGDSWYQIIRDSYNYICAPRQMGEVYTTSSSGEYEIEFRDEDGQTYGFDGLSSGERSVLNFMVNYVYKRMKNSIVLIDELESHLHPPWQRRLLQNLTRLPDGNQFIIATHSPTLLQSVRSTQHIDLGALDEYTPDTHPIG